MELDLIQRIKDFKPTEAYITTFSIDLHYYEGFLLPLLQQLGCAKNVVIADSNKINDSLDSDPAYLAKLGREYLLISVHSEYAFHPKIYLFKKVLKDTTELLCFVGSGNLTYPGLNTNQELFVEEYWSGKGDAPASCESVLDYLNVILGSYGGEAPKLAKKWLMDNYPHAFRKQSPDQANLLRYPDKLSIFDQFIDRLGKRPVKSLFVTAPFYDDDLSAIKSVISSCKPKKIEMLIQPGKTLISMKKLRSLVRSAANTTVIALDPKEHPGRYLHAKMLVAHADDGEHVLVGSANISDVALFGREKVFNYEACIYSREGAKESILENLGIAGSTNVVDIDKLSDKTVEMPEEESRPLSMNLISAECYNGMCHFIIHGAEKRTSVDMEIVYCNGQRKTLAIGQKKGSKETFGCEEKIVAGAISARVIEKKSVYGKWMPLLFVSEIERRSRRYFTKAEKIKNSFLCATNEISQDYYLDMIVDSLIDDSLRSLESRIRTPKDTTQKESSATGRANIEIEAETPMRDEGFGSGSEMDFAEGLDYVISVLRERCQSGRMEEDVTNTEQDKEFEEYDDKIQETKNGMEDIDVLYFISRRLRSRRRVFVQNETVTDPLIKASYFSLITLPHIPKLHRYYIGDDKARHSCVDDDDWEEFLVDACNALGQLLFKAPSKSGWPVLAVGQLKKDIFEACTASAIYSFSTLYPFLLNRSSGLGDEGFNSSMSLNRFVALSAALINSYLKIEGSTIGTLKAKLTEICEHFPCGWMHVERSLHDFMDVVEECEKHDFSKPFIGKAGELYWYDSRELMLSAKGRREPVWKRN